MRTDIDQQYVGANVVIVNVHSSCSGPTTTELVNANASGANYGNLPHASTWDNANVLEYATASALALTTPANTASI
ncbi:hypothetical protein L7F22_034548 [Adiantum nelumboides]|nr:hypothetical protein [Adiantum nelumboides]